MRIMEVLAVALPMTPHVVAKLWNESAVEKMRRLQQPFPQACVDACPAASTFYEDMMALPEEGALGQRVKLMCSHEDTVRCMSEGGVGFAACQNIALNQRSPTALDEVECHCILCTTLVDRIIVSAGQLEEKGELAMENKMPLLCQQVGLDVCFFQNAESCLWAVDDLGFNELPTAEECDSEGHPTARRAPWSSSEYGGPDGRHTGEASGAQQSILSAIGVPGIAAAFVATMSI